MRRISVLCTALVVLTGACASDDAPEPWAAAVERAEAHLAGRAGDIDPAMTLVLTRLERRFGLDWTEEQREAALARAGDAGSLRYLRRLDDPAVRADPAELAARAQGPDAVTLPALFCGDVPAATADSVAPLAQASGYELTHGALALQWLVENGCAGEAEVSDLRAGFVDRLSAEAERSGPDDVGIEAIAMLSYLGAADRIESRWIDQVVAVQNADGGWGEKPGLASNDHTSTLALWVLLEASERDRADVPWIPPASSQP